MRTKIHPVGLLLLTALAAFTAGAHARDAASLSGRVHELTLANGMRWYFVERHNAPTFTGVIMVKVGGVDERPGKTGLAHLFEHMAFKGTTVIGTEDYAAEKPILEQLDDAADRLSAERAKEKPDEALVKELAAKVAALYEEEKKFIVPEEFWQTYQRNGAGSINAWTSKDVTAYHVSLPANRLELFCLMEAQRLAEPVFREFYVERDVVLEEHRMRIDTSPTGKLYVEFINAAFTSHPYQWEVLGSVEDMRLMSAKDAVAFRQTYYAPGNAVGVLVGDFTAAKAEKLVRKYFEPIPAGPPPPAVAAAEPPQSEERRVDVPFDAEPSLLVGYHIPTYPDADAVTLNVISGLLTSGRSSRLYTRLVKEKELATDVATYTDDPGMRYPHLFIVEATPRAPHTAAEVEAAIYDELDRLKTEPVSKHELQKVKNRVEADFLWGLTSNIGLAHAVAYYVQVFGDWRYVDDYRRLVKKTTANDVMRVAAKYFAPTNRTVATLVKPAQEK